MNIFSRIFATPEVIEKTVDAAISAGDKIWFTEEEKADGRKEMRAWFLDYLKATAGHNLARRYIAMVITGVWAFLIMSASLGWIVSPAYAEYNRELLTDAVSEPYNWIIGFYFLTHMVKPLAKK